MNTYLAVLFGTAFIGVWIIVGILINRDRKSYADEIPKTPYQKDDMEQESKENATK